MDDLSNLDPTIQRRVSSWLEGPYDEKTKAEIRRLLKEDPKTLQDAFSFHLAFGTGGLRGIMGVGTGRLNKYTISMATQGLANYLLQQKRIASDLSVIIGFDCRNHSKEFAEISAQVLAANGIHAYLLKNLRPTPFISFACRYKKCTAAIMITASHNPPEYNGYKIYWDNGGQVVPPHDKGIMSEVNKIKDPRQVLSTALNDPLITIIDDNLDNAYLEALSKTQNREKDNKKRGHELKICYTSLHGTGIIFVPKALQKWGFNNLSLVEEQTFIDGNFPNAPSPNPESKEALTIGISKMRNTGSDILIITDPDADRMAAAVMHHAEPVILNGNEIAAIFTHYLCEILTSQNRMPQNGAFITTIVTSELVNKIAAQHNHPCFDVLIGFKYISEKISEWERAKTSYQFLLGAEESYGYLIGTHSLDKDGIVAACLISEIALFMKEQKKTLVDLLYQIYEKYGVFREDQTSINFPSSKDGLTTMNNIMTELRNHIGFTFCDEEIASIDDYLTGTRFSPKSPEKEKLLLPQSNILVFHFASGNKVVIRPSGTEPKIKIYAFATCKKNLPLGEKIITCDQIVQKLLEKTKNTLKT